MAGPAPGQVFRPLQGLGMLSETSLPYLAADVSQLDRAESLPIGGQLGLGRSLARGTRPPYRPVSLCAARLWSPEGSIPWQGATQAQSSSHRVW